MTLARDLLDAAVAGQQSSYRLRPGDDVDAIRAEIRRLARNEGVRIRTGLVDDVLAVVRADAEIWRDDTATMRRKLDPDV